MLCLRVLDLPQLWVFPPDSVTTHSANCILSSPYKLPKKCSHFTYFGPTAQKILLVSYIQPVLFPPTQTALTFVSFWISPTLKNTFNFSLLPSAGPCFSPSQPHSKRLERCFIWYTGHPLFSTPLKVSRADVSAALPGEHRALHEDGRKTGGRHKDVVHKIKLSSINCAQISSKLPYMLTPHARAHPYVSPMGDAAGGMH